MRPPWIEAAALLGSVGRPLAPDTFKHWSITTPDERFVLFRKLAPGEKPLVLTDLPALARRIHHERGAAGIQLQDFPAPLHTGQDAIDGVSIWTLDASGERSDYLGWAYLDGRDREALQAALDANEPVTRRPGLLDYPGQRDGCAA